MTNKRTEWARHALGRVLLHLGCLGRGGDVRFHLTGVWRQLREVLLAVLLLAMMGCGSQSEPPSAPSGMATQGSSAEATATYADPQLAELTRELRRWIVKSKQRPASFEEFAAAAQIQVPTPPPGKRFALSPEMRVILVDR